MMDALQIGEILMQKYFELELKVEIEINPQFLGQNDEKSKEGIIRSAPEVLA